LRREGKGIEPSGRLFFSAVERRQRFLLPERSCAAILAAPQAMHVIKKLLDVARRNAVAKG
jgi:hypothetical protein